MNFTPTNPQVIEAEVIDALRSCFDPEIPVNIYDLGLVYEINVASSGEVTVRMTLTSPNCPVAESLPAEVDEKIKTLPGVKTARVEVVFDPPWDPSMMSEAARLELGML